MREWRDTTACGGKGRCWWVNGRLEEERVKVIHKEQQRECQREGREEKSIIKFGWGKCIINMMELLIEKKVYLEISFCSSHNFQEQQSGVYLRRGKVCVAVVTTPLHCFLQAFANDLHSTQPCRPFSSGLFGKAKINFPKIILVLTQGVWVCGRQEGWRGVDAWLASRRRGCGRER